MSALRLGSVSESTSTERSTARFSPAPDWSFVRILIPIMFQLSGGTVPFSRRVAVRGIGIGCCPSGGAGGGSGAGAGRSGRRGSGSFSSGGAWASSAVFPVIRKVLESKVTSSLAGVSRYQTRLKFPWPCSPDANPKSPFSTNSAIFCRSTRSGSSSLVRDPLRKLCRRLLRGHVPLSLRAGGQCLSM